MPALTRVILTRHGAVSRNTGASLSRWVRLDYGDLDPSVGFVRAQTCWGDSIACRKRRPHIRARWRRIELNSSIFAVALARSQT